MPVAELVEAIRAHPDCEVVPHRSERITFPDGLILPSDVQEFYSICNGTTLHKSGEYPYRILSVDEVEHMDRQYYGECWCGEEVISSPWYFIAENWNADKIAIDTHPSRLGRCYDCFVGESYPVIAKSFEELLMRLFKNAGEYTYWLKLGFTPGDPCDF